MNDNEMIEKIVKALRIQRSYQTLGLLDFKHKNPECKSNKQKWHCQGSLDLIDWILKEIPELKRLVDA